MEKRDTRVFRIPGLPGLYKIPGVYISPSEPVEQDAVLWVNPYGNKRTDETPPYHSAYGAASSILNDIYISTAKKYSTIGDALAGSNETTSGTVLAYTLGGVLNIVLTANIDSSATIDVTKDCAIHLNGHKISFAAGTNLNLTSGKLTINGTVAGSEITKDIQRGALEYLINVDSTEKPEVDSTEKPELRLFGGVYSIHNKETATGNIILIRTAPNKAEKITLSGCTVNMNCSGQAIFGAYIMVDTTIDNCTFNVQVDTCKSKHCNAIGTAASEAAVTIRNSTVIITGKNAQSVIGVTFGSNGPVVENCTILSSANTNNAECLGIKTAEVVHSLTINNCHVNAIGQSPESSFAMDVLGSTNAIINNGYYCGGVNAFKLADAAYINGKKITGNEYYFTSAAMLSVKDENDNWIAVC